MAEGLKEIPMDGPEDWVCLVLTTKLFLVAC